MRGVLAGIRVLDFSTLLPGPLATLFLADAGAEVIKIENPARGDEMRIYEPKWGKDSVNFQMLNRGKKSLAVNLKSPEAHARLQPLLASADILVEQFRPGVMERLGFGYEAVRAIKPDIIYCSITGYGQTGPAALRAGHDLNYQGEAGLLDLSHGQTPSGPPTLVADIAGGTYPALINILLALRHRDQTGEGTRLDIAMAENLFPFTYWSMAEGQLTGRWPGNGDGLTNGGSCRYALYSCADGRLAAVAAIEEKFWAAFCAAIGLAPELRDDSRDPDATSAAIRAIIASRPSAEWEKIFEAADCCCSIVKTMQEASANPHFAARGVLKERLEGPDGQTIAALPTPIAQAFRGEPSPAAPGLGENDQEFS